MTVMVWAGVMRASGCSARAPASVGVGNLGLAGCRCHTQHRVGVGIRVHQGLPSSSRARAVTPGGVGEPGATGAARDPLGLPAPGGEPSRPDDMELNARICC